MDKHSRSLAFLAGAFCAALSASGCTTHQCDAHSISIGADTGGTGFWIADDCQNSTTSCSLIWHSTDTMNSNWTDFPGNATLTFTFPPLPPLPAGLTPDFADISWNVSVAAGPPIPDASTFNVTPAAGQLAEFMSWSSSSISVLNASCQGYQLLLLVTVPVLAPDGGLPGDGAVEADSGDASAQDGSATTE